MLFRGDLNSPGTLQLLALMLTFAGLAFTYDLLFGFTGLLSFGHALYFAVGVYVAGIAMTKWHWGFWPSVLFTALVGLVLPLFAGAVSLRVGGIAFAMVTLAFAQAGSVLAFKNPYQLTGGEDGFGVDYTKLPVCVRRDLQHEEPLLARARLPRRSCSWSGAGRSTPRPGHVWQAIRENELRVEVLGLRPFWFKLMSFVLASFLATLGGVVYLMRDQRRQPVGDDAELHARAARDGRDRRRRLRVGRADRRARSTPTSTTGSATSSSSHAVSTLPKVLRTPLEQPLFILGLLFILVVYFAPGGLARLGRIRRRPAALEEAL